MKDILRKQNSKNPYIAQISVLSDVAFIGHVQAFVISFAKYFNFCNQELMQIELMIEEGMLSTIQNAFSDEVVGMIDVKISYSPGKFRISIEDKGLPVDIKMLETSDNSYMSILLLKKIADEFRFTNLGKEGKKLELIKYIRNESILEQLAKIDKEEIQEELPPEKDPPTIRLIDNEEITLLSRLAFKVYGYTYISVFYYPEKIKELLEHGLLVSAVAVNQKNEIVGNLSLVFEKSDDMVADSGAAMVDPRYRGHNLFKNMKLFLKDYAEKRGMCGIYSEAVTIHLFTQLGNISLGAKETGIMLAFIKESVTFNKISDERTELRQSVVLYYLKTNKEPHRTIYVYPKFADIIRKIYAHAELDREVVEVDAHASLIPASDSTHYSTSVKPDINVAYIKIETMGPDVDDIIAVQTRQLCLKKIETIYLEFSMSEAYASVLARKANEMGYMFSGVIPELCDGDVLKMQYLNNVIVIPEHINLAGELSKEILEVIVQDYHV